MSESPPDRARQYAWLDDALGESRVVLTASRRLARELRAAHDSQQMSLGRSAWDSPAILYWHDWCRALLLENASADSKMFLSASASIVLWERSFRKHLEADLLSVGALVRQAASAWQRLQDYCIQLTDVEAAAGNSDERLFVRVAKEYRRSLEEQGWIDNAQLPAAAVDQIASGQVALPSTVSVAGFDRRSPVLDRLLQALNDRHCELNDVPSPSPVRRLSAQPYADVEAELRAAGHWARRILEDRPTARIGIVSSDLNTEASRYARLLREGLVPGWQTGAAEYRHAVNVSFGRQLSEYPAIATALLVLRWVSAGLSGSEVSVLLRSAYLHGHDPAANASLELELRRHPDRQWSAAALVDALTDSRAPTGQAHRLSVFGQVASAAIRASEQGSPAFWASQLHELLDSVGWPGDEALSSEDFQLVNRWRELLNEFAALDIVLPAMTLHFAISKVAAMAGDTVYQADTGPGLVSLLGGLEAAGMEFDELWVSGLDADRWPAPGNPLSLVSRRLQRERSMPDADPANSLEYSRRVLQRLTASASSVALSWSRTENDAALMPSPLLEEWSLPEGTQHDDPGWYASCLLGKVAVDHIVDDPLPAVHAPERLSGGSGVIALQRQDPFLAFAVGRLGVRELEAFQPGLSPRLRGVVLHESLEGLLHSKPSQAELRAWTSEDVSSRIANSVDRAIARCEKHADAVLRRLLAFERRRLIVVVENFLAQEAERDPFQVSAVEEKLAFEHAGLVLALRADRVDLLPNGSIHIVDYKSGNAKKRIIDRNGDIVEPQLAVYAAATPQQVSGLVLINVTRRAIDYVGVGGCWGKFSAEEWPTVLEGWKADVYRSIEELAAGDVRVNVLPGASAYPQLDVLSRVEELRRRG